VDAAGRLKLPAKFQDHIKKLADGTMYVTLVGGIARIYTNRSWDRYEEKLRTTEIAPVEANRRLMLANHFGEDVEMDSQGRVTLPQGLRGRLDIVNKPVQLLFFGDEILIRTEENYNQLLAEALALEAADTTALEKARL
jgi:MraZ protein